MRLWGRIRFPSPSESGKQASTSFRRDRLATLLMVAAVAGLGLVLFFSKGTQVLMPGPLTSGHGAIKKCSACHSQSGSGKLSWVHGLVAADPLADSKACLACHKMPDTAFNAHGASASVLKQSTKRLIKTAATTIEPRSARAQAITVPMDDVMARGLFCATCHQEHQGTSFNLSRISNEQCRSCHVVRFDSFDGQHPKFETFPFERRTRIVYDHAGHFNKHFPETAKKNPARRIPANCASCHNSNEDRRIMALVPFEQTCAACHLDQIVGNERVSGPKGVAFLALPGLDLDTLQKKNAPIGEWPDASEAALTPFMKIMIGRNEKGRALLKSVDGLNLQDLTAADDNQIKAVTDLVWEIKGLIHALITGKASDVLGKLDVGGGAKPGAINIADLTASFPRDAVIGAQQEWLPNLAAEMGSGKAAPAEEAPDESADQTDPAPAPEEPVGDAPAEIEVAEAEPPAEETVCADGQPQGGGEVAAPETEAADALDGEAEEAPSADELAAAEAAGRQLLPSGTPRAIKARNENTGKRPQPDGASGRSEDCVPKQEGAAPEANVEEAASPADGAETGNAAGEEAPPEGEQPAGQAGDQSDDLLFPTQDEAGASNSAEAETASPDQPQAAETASEADGAASTGEAPDAGTAAANPQAQAAPAVAIEGEVEPENWAEYGGWYRQDFSIFYRPVGHRDRFLHSWLSLAGSQASKGDARPAGEIFEALSGKDSQGSCTKCHSVDDAGDKGLVVNFSPASVSNKVGRFTNFVHEPHLGIMDERGCLACHDLAKNRPYLKSFEQRNPAQFVSGFGEVKKDLCQACHTAGMARQDCLLCHDYHVNRPTMPVINTAFPNP